VAEEEFEIGSSSAARNSRTDGLPDPHTASGL
jgi:hypothetical protein